jgi:hypothetical protein
LFKFPTDTKIVCRAYAEQRKDEFEVFKTLGKKERR